MWSKINSFLNGITMYRLVLYYLIVVSAWAGVLSLFHLLPFNFIDFSFSISFLLVFSLITNYFFSKAFSVTPNTESVYITALILALVITPSSPLNFPLLFWASILSQSSKYILTFHQKHLFNPVAVSLFLTSMVLGWSASWWVGTSWMLPVVLLGGFLILQRIRRWDLALSYLVANYFITIIYTVIRGFSPFPVLPRLLVDSPLIFFTVIMLTEPLTAPPTHRLRVLYGSLIGTLMVFTTPEIALLIGNFFSFLTSPDSRRFLILREKIALSPDIYDFIFSPDRPLIYLPGQYLEWTLRTSPGDSRGNRRYFTLASSPTEPDLRLGVRFYPQSSQYKRTLLQLPLAGKISVANLAGDFTLPADHRQKLVFIAGGIGITPFRSMIKYLLDRQEQRSITLFYQAKTDSEFVYQDVFSAAQSVGVHTFYLTHRLTFEYLQSQLHQLDDYVYYLSGPQAQVDTYQKLLLNNHVSRSHIKTDYFPGF